MMTEFTALQNPKTKRWINASVYHTEDIYPLERRPDAILCLVHCEALGYTLDAGAAIVREHSITRFDSVAKAREAFNSETP